MRIIRSVILIVFLLASFHALAQQHDGAPIEKQMTAEEFTAAGLGKLSPDELARLNTWLNRTVMAETRKAVTESKREDETRGNRLLNIGGGDAFQARMVGHFDGFERGKKYTLDNGQVWQQIDDTRMYGVKLDNPTVQMKPSAFGNAWYMRVDERAVNAKVKRIK